MPDRNEQARKILLQRSQFVMSGNILHLVDSKRKHRLRVAVPQHLTKQLLDVSHRGPNGGHFSVSRTYKSLADKCWWEGTYGATQQFVKNCPECAIVSGTGHYTLLGCTLLDSTTLYHASAWLYLILLYYTTLYHGSTWLYLTPLDSTELYHDST